MYRLFASKEDLVAAYLESEDQHYREWFTAAADSALEPRDRILAVFDALAVQVRHGRCRGCPFLIAIDEIPDRGLASHKNAVTMKSWVRAQFTRLAEDFTVGTSTMDPAALADQLMLIMEGLYATVAEFDAEGPAARAKDLVRSLLATGRRCLRRRVADRGGMPIFDGHEVIRNHE
ncbi:hypothetical protein ACW9HC_32320 [Nocardia gipuzkoensis]